MAFVETDIDVLAPTRTSVVGNIQDYFAQRGVELSEDPAIKVLAYHNQFRALNNDMFGAASLGDTFETRRKGFSKLASAANELADAVPFGSFAKPFTLAAKAVSGALEEKEQRKIFESANILNPSHDPVTAAATSRALADNFTEKNIAAIAACKDERAAQALATQQCAEMVEVLGNKQEEMRATYIEIAYGRASNDALIDFVCKSAGVETTHEENHEHHFQDSVTSHRANHHGDSSRGA